MNPLSLYLLGGFSLRSPEGEEIRVPTRKSRALLAYLSLGGEQPVRREQLAGLLWSEKPESRARHSLTQSLSELCAATAGVSYPLQITRDAVRLNREFMRVDVVCFEQAIADPSTCQLDEAAELCTGSFLPDLTDLDPSFDEWRGARQSKLEESARQVYARAIAEQVDDEQCLTLAQRLLDLDPYDERAHRALMRVHANRGNRHRAKQQFDTCRELLERDLGVTPESETLVLTKALETPRKTERIDKTTRDKPSIAVIPFRNLSEGSDDAYFADAIVEEIRTALGHFKGVIVFAGDSSRVATDQATSSIIAAAELGVDYLLEGSVRKVGDHVRITVKLIDGRTEIQLWADRYDGILDDVFKMQNEVAQRIVGLLAREVEGDARGRAERKSPTELSAYDWYLRGMHYIRGWKETKEEVRLARDMFERAIDLDADFSTAIAGLAACCVEEFRHGWAEDPDEMGTLALEHARRAVRLDEADSFARFVLASGYFHVKRNYDLAKAQVETALELNPNDYHYYCFKAWLSTCRGDFEDGIFCGQQALIRNPLLPDMCLWSIGFAQYLAGQYDEAIGTFSRMSSHGEDVLACLAACYAQLERMELAQQSAAEYRAMAEHERRDPKSWCTYWQAFLPFEEDDALTHLVEGLRKAGLAD